MKNFKLFLATAPQLRSTVQAWLWFLFRQEKGLEEEESYTSRRLLHSTTHRPSLLDNK